jgi:hypothetical protein
MVCTEHLSLLNNGQQVRFFTERLYEGCITDARYAVPDVTKQRIAQKKLATGEAPECLPGREEEIEKPESRMCSGSGFLISDRSGCFHAGTGC